MGKFMCKCGCIMCDNTDGISYKARLIADQDFFTFLDEIESECPHKAPSNAWRYIEDMFQCPDCGNLIIFRDERYDFQPVDGHKGRVTLSITKKSKQEPNPLTERIDAILSNDALDSDDCEESKCGLIEEELIPQYGWEAVREAMIRVLLDDSRRAQDYEATAAVFWGAVLDCRDVPVNEVIALLYHRLPHDDGSSENNLAWSITCNLKNVDYLSEYDPLEDPEVFQAGWRLGIKLERKG